MANAPTLVDQYGQPIRRDVLTQEIARATVTGVRSPITGYPGDGLNPGRLAALLREADQGEPLRYLELAEQIEERDLHYAGVLGTRKRSVSQLDVTVEAASDDKADVDKADMVRAWLSRDELQDEVFDILDAIGKGVSFTEICWDTSQGQWSPGKLEWRDPRWFRFSRDDGKTPLLRGDGGDEPLPGGKFICAVMRAKSGLPIRSGIARLATWSWMFKAFTLRDWAIFTQTFGQPIRVGKYGAGATEADKDTLFNAVANIAGDCAAIVPESMNIEFIESKSTGANLDLYLKRCDWLDQQISKAVLGQTATTDAVTGGLGSGKEHRQVQEDIERADAKALSAILNRDLIRVWMLLEYGTVDGCPRLRIGRAEDRDVKQLVEGVKDLVPMGLRVSKSWMNDQLGIPDPDTADELLAAPVTPSPSPPPPIGGPALQSDSRAPGGGPATRDEVDALATAAENIAQGGTDAMIDYIRGLVDGATSLQAVQESLVKARPNMPEAQLTRLMRIALAMAELSGRADIAADS
ncbi:MAG: DUF935 family protein [Rhodopseudomonas sp.]|nr:DUF935 family protein [Rhodopseudomonas sp.]